MPFVNVNIVLDKPLEPDQRLAFPYPEGLNEASFFGAFNHNLVVDDVFCKSPIDFVIIPRSAFLELHWRKNQTVAKGKFLHVRLEELGTNAHYDAKNNVTLVNTFPANLFMINLRAPLPRDHQFYIPPMQLTKPGALPLAKNHPDVPRNVIIAATVNATQVQFKIVGQDVYNRNMTEVITGPNAGIRSGKKAFNKILSIQASQPCNGDIAVGVGNRIGLPVFLPAEGYVVQEMIGSAVPQSPGLLIPGDIGAPTATSGDRRGTYTPPSTAALNGRNGIYLLMSLPNPGNIGSEDFFEA
ncbi:hypothetical protein GC177_00315 [bacterium]|nr:hypothetical protein [bacterium]